MVFTVPPASVFVPASPPSSLSRSNSFSSPWRTITPTPSTPTRNKENILPCGTPIPRSSPKRCKAKESVIGSCVSKSPRRTRSETKRLLRVGTLSRSGSLDSMELTDDFGDAIVAAEFRATRALLMGAHEDVIALNEADRRARELTESPLADVSEAFLTFL
ncbi:hypothetical protein BV25DRAFT_1821149 [Artomyces pyxidatus]|uniref:Uncharacterized protein n=1 Tax=Artomyces pyxidatus TaxID=48021 RepID=A0ACB8TCB4_9AGAM|nr:hypothetical protein BV25DRAFT_1821149 [Artomyces pyxidatus]